MEGYSNVHLFNFGLGEKEESATLFFPKAGSGIASVYRRRLDHFGTRMDHAEEIKLTTLDSFCNENNIEYIDFLKLDVEGHELSVLRGGSDMIGSDSIARIQFEFGGCNIDSKTYFQDFYYLLSKSYHIYRILKYGLYKINGYRETEEIFTTTNFLAVLRKLPLLT